MANVRTHAEPALLTGRPRVQTQWVWGRNERRRWAIFAIKLAIFLAPPGWPWTAASGAPSASRAARSSTSRPFRFRLLDAETGREIEAVSATFFAPAAPVSRLP